MHDNIGSTAGKIWQWLDDNKNGTITGLSRELDHSDRDVMMALGWLAREDKIRFQKSGRTMKISLNQAPSEQA